MRRRRVTRLDPFRYEPCYYYIYGDMIDGVRFYCDLSDDCDNASVGYKADGDDGRFLQVWILVYEIELVIESNYQSVYVRVSTVIIATYFIADWRTPVKTLPVDLENTDLNFRTSIQPGDNQSIGFLFSQSPKSQLIFMIFSFDVRIIVPTCTE